MYNFANQWPQNTKGTDVNVPSAYYLFCDIDKKIGESYNQYKNFI